MHRRTIAAGAVLAVALSSAAAFTADAAPGRAGTHDKAGAYRVTATVNRTEPLVGTKVTIKGTVSPAAPGAKVILQVRYQGRKHWKVIGRATLTGAGTYRFKDEVTRVRTRTYRALKPAGAGHAAGRATTGKVTVFGWRPLTSLAPVQASGLREVPSVDIAGTTYPDSIVSYVFEAGMRIDYELDRDCKVLDTTFGLSDLSSSPGRAIIDLFADNVSAFSGGFALTGSQAVVADVTGVLRITIVASVANGGIAAVASPRVLCSF
jgi:hypothetical protein